MPQELLHGPDIVVGLQQVCSKRMAKGVNIDRFGYANQAYSGLNSFLETVFMDVMPSDFTRPWVFGQPFCRKYILPSPFEAGIRIFPLKGIGQIDTSISLGHIVLIHHLHPFQMLFQRWL